MAYETRPVPDGVYRLSPLCDGLPRLGPFAFIIALLRFRRWVRVIEPDLVQAGPVPTGGLVAALAGFHPLLVMSWGSDVLVYPNRNPVLRWVTRFTLRRADMVLGDCQAVRDRVLALSSLSPEKIVFFPWGIDLTRFEPRSSELGLRQKLGWEGCQIVISTRSFERIHGPLIFLEAMAQVMRQRSGVRALMLGDGSLRPQVETFVAEHGLQARINLAGQVPHTVLPDYFNEADLYVSTTYSDGTSISLLEAMACRLPVIVTDGHGNREWVTPGANGWLYPAGDTCALAAAILEALDNEARRRAMGGVNLAIVRERANWDTNFRQLLLAYDRLLVDTQIPKVKFDA